MSEPSMHKDGEAADNAHGPRPTVDRKLLDMLVCPVTKSVLHYDHARQELVSFAAKVAYPIRDSIPIMLIEEARALSDEELAAHKAGKKA